MGKPIHREKPVSKEKFICFKCRESRREYHKETICRSRFCECSCHSESQHFGMTETEKAVKLNPTRLLEDSSSISEDSKSLFKDDTRIFFGEIVCGRVMPHKIYS